MTRTAALHIHTAATHVEGEPVPRGAGHMVRAAHREALEIVADAIEHGVPVAVTDSSDSPFDRKARE